GARLSELGRREDALAATQEAADIRRTLAAARPDAFLPDLAISLNNLGDQRLACGEHDAAIEAYTECARVLKPFADALPAVHGSLFETNNRDLIAALKSKGQSEDEIAVHLWPLGIAYEAARSDANMSKLDQETAIEPVISPDRLTGHGARPSRQSGDAQNPKRRGGRVLAVVLLILAVTIGLVAATLIWGLPPGTGWAEPILDRVRRALGSTL
ncbi:MAG: hypothetical protein ACK4SV_14660, partial [Hyphomonas sp.]